MARRWFLVPAVQQDDLNNGRPGEVPKYGDRVEAYSGQVANLSEYDVTVPGPLKGERTYVVKFRTDESTLDEIARNSDVFSDNTPDVSNSVFARIFNAVTDKALTFNQWDHRTQVG